MVGEQGACFLLLKPPEFAELWELVCRLYLVLEIPHPQGVVRSVQVFGGQCLKQAPMSTVHPWRDFERVSLSSSVHRGADTITPQPSSSACLEARASLSHNWCRWVASPSLHRQPRVREAELLVWLESEGRLERLCQTVSSWIKSQGGFPTNVLLSLHSPTLSV